eukprot:TRINITY_DN6295_c0_g1_i1.p1 TRINITY_DN6295_c0_g1~~TRINITY_DN6295_c0_g1_i1.p1  ORF type:complete len:698 (+),score=96.03 TRINITY_DN6295_c0_g1_i1:2-2095(+)
MGLCSVVALQAYRLSSCYHRQRSASAGMRTVLFFFFHVFMHILHALDVSPSSKCYDNGAQGEDYLNENEQVEHVLLLQTQHNILSQAVLPTSEGAMVSKGVVKSATGSTERSLASLGVGMRSSGEHLAKKHGEGKRDRNGDQQGDNHASNTNHENATIQERGEVRAEVRVRDGLGEGSGEGDGEGHASQDRREGSGEGNAAPTLGESSREGRSDEGLGEGSGEGGGEGYVAEGHGEGHAGEEHGEGSGEGYASEGHRGGLGEGDGEAHATEGYRKETAEGIGEGSGEGHGESKASRSVAVVLLGTVGWVMSLFYFVNWPDVDIRRATWDVLSSMICIFCAVLLFSVTKDTMVAFAGEHVGDHHSPPDAKSIVLSMLRFGLCFAMLQALFLRYKHNSWKLKYTTSLGSHVVGFAAIDLFGSILQAPAFSKSLATCCVATGVLTLMMVIIYFPMHAVRVRMGERQQFIEQCGEAEIESFGLCLGLLVSMLIRFSISGYLPPVHGSPKGKSFLEDAQLFGVSMFLGVALVLVSINRSRLPPASSLTLTKSMHALQETISMATGWCMLFTGYWVFYSTTADAGIGSGGQMEMKVFMMLVFSAICFISMLGIDAIADRVDVHFEKGLRALLNSFALLVGLSWEATFAGAVVSIGSTFEDARTRAMVNVAITVGLCLVVLPAWGLYILPNTSDCKDEKLIRIP